ncbi:MAG TPA: hypothetical protein VHE81_11355 [Lacipirellulaceae bacterium]|nr:hypothetical protein [Lacipirellulaceae bacterium]
MKRRNDCGFRIEDYLLASAVRPILLSRDLSISYSGSFFGVAVDAKHARKLPSAIRRPRWLAGWLLICATLLLVFAARGAVAVDLRIATFKADVTPPPGSPLCDGLVPPATGVNDPLSARGIVLQADRQKPVVLVAVDWVGIGNEGHDAWCRAIAEACKTTVHRVCVHTLHQHDAPGCDFLAERIAARAGLPNQLFPVEFAHEAIRRVAAAAAKASTHLENVTDIGYGKGLVKKVASNRRILGPDGKVKFVRFSAAMDPKLRALPEGTIDPYVRMLTFWNKDRPLAVLTYYATHPQSYYYTGKCSADFVGMARDEAQAAEKTELHIHFNGAGGNIAAGKYNDGSHAMRPVLAHRLAAGMKRAWDDTKKIQTADLTFDWSTRDVKLPLGQWYDDNEQEATLHNKSEKLIPRLRAARNIAWAQRAKDGPPITIARLRLNKPSRSTNGQQVKPSPAGRGQGEGPSSIDILFMPGEPFVEYQLAAQKMKPEAFVCMAGYGDYGPGYIGTAIAYTQGGYETGFVIPVSRVSPRVEGVLMNAMQELLK